MTIDGTSTITNGDRWLCPRDAAARMGLSERTLVSWRQLGKGPAYVRLDDHICGRVRYSADDIDAFMRSRLRRHTAEESVAALAG